MILLSSSLDCEDVKSEDLTIVLSLPVSVPRLNRQNPKHAFFERLQPGYSFACSEIEAHVELCNMQMQRTLPQCHLLLL